jgi:hypothetical protein
VDGNTCHQCGAIPKDRIRYLAKVRVAANPAIRSKSECRSGVGVPVSTQRFAAHLAETGEPYL